MTRFIPKTVIAVLVIMLLLTPVFQVAAASVDEGYGYNSYDESVPAPAGYQDDLTVYGQVSPEGSFGMAQDMATYDGELYVLNSKIGIITVLNADLEYQRSIRFTRDGEELSVVGANGMFLDKTDDGLQILLADTENQRVLRADATGRVMQVYQKPTEELFPQKQEFRPTKVLVGSDKTVYVICQGVYKGAVTFSADGEFLGFYGSNDIDITAAMLLEHFWKSLMNQEQLGRVQQNVSIEFTNFAADSRGFIYTCTRVTDNSMGEIKRLNAKGINLLPVDNYGDLEDAWIKSEHQDTAFVDIVSINDNLVAALDTQRGRVFLYSNDGMLLMIFGGSGQFQGTFRTPSALECIGDSIYVLDPYKDSITRFAPTSYGTALLTASSLYQDGRYAESLDLWKQVIRQNGNFETAYVGIGRALMGQEDYAGAMDYFKKGQDRTGYSQAYKEYRKTSAQFLVAPTLIASVVLLVVYGLYVRYLRGPKREVSLITASVARRCSHTLLHPTDGFTALMNAPRRGISVLCGILITCLFGVAILHRQATAFVFNENKLEELDIRMIFAITVIVFFAFVLSNRLVCTLFNGNGAVREIICVCAVSLIPMMLAMVLKIAISHFLSLDEGGLLTALMVIGIMWSVLLLLAGMRQIHEYDTKQAVLSVIFTVIGMMLMAFIGLLVYGLYNQIAAFFGAIIDEISYIGMT